MKVPFVDLISQYKNIKPEIDKSIKRVIEDSAFIGGKYVKEFENEFKNIYGVKHCVPLANGTDAIYLALRALNIGLGDEVITTAFSWISTSETISQTGAKPVFVDIDSIYYTIDTKLIESKINKNTKAIIPVHLYGQMADIEEIKKICDRHNLYMIEDCAQSHFSEYKDLRAGLWGDIGTFSFYPGKNLGAYGDAGCVITSNELFSKKIRMLANHGALIKHEHKLEGVNSRLDGIQAAILNVKLKYILEWTVKRKKIANYYIKRLNKIGDIILPKIRKNSSHSFHLFVIKTNFREKLKEFLSKNQISTAIHYPTALPFLQAYDYLKYKREEFPQSYNHQKTILSLPMYPELSKDKQDFVISKIIYFYENLVS